MKGECQGPESIDRIVEEGKVVRVVVAVLLRVVADDNGAGPQVRGDHLHGRPRHGNPDVDQHEIHKPILHHFRFSFILTDQNLQ